MPDKIYICRDCKVQVVSKTDHSPILGRAHKRGCFRWKRGR